MTSILLTTAFFTLSSLISGAVFAGSFREGRHVLWVASALVFSTFFALLIIHGVVLGQETLNEHWHVGR